MTDSEDLYKEVISIQKTLYDHHQDVREELDQIKTSINDRIAPLEAKVSRHEHTFELATKLTAWIFPSGVLLGIIGWFNNLFGGSK